MEKAPLPVRKNTPGKWVCFVLAELFLFASIFFFILTVWTFSETASLSDRIDSGEAEEQIPGAGVFAVMSFVAAATAAGVIGVGCWCGAVFLGIFPLVRTVRPLKILAIVHMGLTALALPLAILLAPILS